MGRERSSRAIPAKARKAATVEGSVGQVSDTKARTAEQIEADIAATRARLASTVDELVDRAHPKNVAKRQVEQAKAQVFDERGQLRTQKLVAVGAAAVGVLGMLIMIRKLVGRR
jgi:anti-sigma factor RsiW